MLTETEAIHYLFRRHLLTKGDIVRRGLVAQELSGRNHNFLIRAGNGSGYFLKQAKLKQSARLAAREAEVYRLLWTHAPEFAAGHMPKLHRYDAAREILTLECVQAARVLTAQSPSTIAIACAQELGCTLGRLHNLKLDEKIVIEAPPPWILSLQRLGYDVFSKFSSSAIAVIRIVQELPHFETILTELSRSKTQNTLVHGDIRGDNCLVVKQGTSNDSVSIFIIDWELAGVGDPCWDVGGVFCEYLNQWVRSMPAMHSLSLDQSLQLAACSLRAAQQRAVAFWSAYEGTRSDFGDHEETLLRAVSMCAARLTQSAVESAQHAARMTRTVVYTLQLAENMLRDPRSAAAQLLQLRPMQW
jgi:thiamine kinase-like enzyme